MTRSVLPSSDRPAPASRTELVAAWTSIYKRPPPKGTGIRLLGIAVAYHNQARVRGGLNRQTKSKLKSIAASDEGQPPSSQASLNTGTRLMREWRGETHVVDITDTGIHYRGEMYNSLSAVARAITGARWSGPRFFGMHK